MKKDKPAVKQEFPGLVKITDGNIIMFVPTAEVIRYESLGYKRCEEQTHNL
jgi:hypothetical protein